MVLALGLSALVSLRLGQLRVIHDAALHATALSLAQSELQLGLAATAAQTVRRTVIDNGARFLVERDQRQTPLPAGPALWQVEVTVSWSRRETDPVSLRLHGARYDGYF